MNYSCYSPSVLDRLNALLEPGGSLTINERGIIDGTTPTITPHPNFRYYYFMIKHHILLNSFKSNVKVQFCETHCLCSILYLCVFQVVPHHGSHTWGNLSSHEKPGCWDLHPWWAWGSVLGHPGSKDGVTHPGCDRRLRVWPADLHSFRNQEHYMGWVCDWIKNLMS